MPIAGPSARVRWAKGPTAQSLSLQGFAANGLKTLQHEAQALQSLIFIHIITDTDLDREWVDCDSPSRRDQRYWRGVEEPRAEPPGTRASTEESTPARGASSARSALNLSPLLRPLPGSGGPGPVYRWCRRFAPQPPANGSVSLRDVYKDQLISPRGPTVARPWPRLPGDRNVPPPYFPESRK